jgi:hypothetical protein
VTIRPCSTMLRGLRPTGLKQIHDNS